MKPEVSAGCHQTLSLVGGVWGRDYFTKGHNGSPYDDVITEHLLRDRMSLITSFQPPLGTHFFHSIWRTEVVFYHVISWNE